MFKNLFSIEGKTALVTGGSRGIGEMIAAGFVANGAKVYISSRKAAACEATAKRLSETLGGTCIALPGDLSQLSGIEAVAKELAAREERCTFSSTMPASRGARRSTSFRKAVGTR